MLSVLSVPSARAAALVWSGVTDSTWATTTNWTPNGTPGTGDTITFNSAGNAHTTISLGGARTINTILFDTASAAAFTIGSGAVGSETLTLNNAGAITINSTVVNNQLFNAALVLGTDTTASTYTITNNSAAGTLTFAGNISRNGTTNTKTLTLAGAGNTVINGIIGGTALAVTANGKVTLAGTNTFTGALTVGGTLSVPVFNNASAAGPLGNSATAVTLNAYSALNYTGATASSTKKLAIGAGTQATLKVASAATDLTLSGVVSGGTLVKDGPGTLVLAAANTHDGLEIDAGTVRLSGTGTFAGSGGTLFVSDGRLDLNGKSITSGYLSSAAPGRIVNDGSGTSTATLNFTGYTYSGGVLSYTSGPSFDGVFADNDNAGAGVVAVTKTGNGDWSFTGANTYSGTTTISGGTIYVSGSGTPGSSAGATNVASGGTLFLSDTNLAGEPVSIAGSGVTLTGYGALTDGALETSGTVTYGGLLSLSAAATIHVYSGTLAITNPGTITGPAHALTLAGAGSGSIASIIGTTTGGVTVSGGTWTLSGVNTFSGIATVSGSSKLVVPTVNNTSTDGPLGRSAATTAITLNTGTLEYTGATASSNKPFTLTTSGTLQIDSAATELTLSGVIAGAGDALIKTGSGTLTLTAANTYSGGTTVSAGTLRLSGSGRPGATTGSLAVNGTLDLNGTTQTVGGLSGSGTIVNNGGGASTLTVNTTVTSNAFSGTIADNNNATTGTVALTKSGTGKVTLSGMNSYSGATLVTAGTLEIANANSLGTLDNGTTVSSGATLLIQGNFLLGGESVTISGAGASGASGALVGNGGPTYGGHVTLAAAATIASDSTEFRLIGGVTGAGLGLTLGGTGEGYITDIITGSSTVTKTGTGKWTLAMNSYTGLTTISAGILAVVEAQGLGTTASGTSITSGATLQIAGDITIGAEALTIRGAGASGATGALENTGGTNNFGGLITLGAASTISSDVGTLNITNTGTIGGAFALTLDGAGDGTIASKIGTASLVKNGPGTWALSGANTYTGTTTVNDGILDVQAAAGLGTTAGGTTVASGATLLLDGNLAIGAEALTISGRGAIGHIGAVESANGDVTYAGLLKLGANAAIATNSTGTLSFTNAGTITGATFTLSLDGPNNGTLASIIGTTTGGVIKQGSGTWALSGANTFTGTLAVIEGTLSVPTFNNASASGPLGNSANAVALGGGATNVILEYSGATATSNKPITLTGFGGALQVDLAGTELTLTGSISGSGQLFKKLGPGTLTLMGGDSFTGDTIIAAGTLKASAGAALFGTASITVQSSATLRLAGTGDRIGNAIPLTLSGGTLSMEGLSNAAETLGNFSLTLANSMIDFGSGSGDSLIFAGVGTHTAGIKLAITNWSGTPGLLGGASNDRLIFLGTSSAFTSAYSQAEVSFNGSNGYIALQYDSGHYELVAVPEPSAAALMAVALFGLGARRHPRRK